MKPCIYSPYRRRWRPVCAQRCIRRGPRMILGMPTCCWICCCSIATSYAVGCRIRKRLAGCKIWSRSDASWWSEKTEQSNRLTSHLKIYFPQIVNWFEHLDTELVCALLLRWPTLEDLQKVPLARLRTFFRKHHCRDQEVIERRILAIRQATLAVRDRAVIEAKSTVVKVIVWVIGSLLEGIADLDEKIQEAAAAHPDFFIFDSLPGAGAVLAPRLLAAFGSQRERYGNAGEVQAYSGIAPVMERSGKKKWVHCRIACPKFLRQ